MFWVTCGLLHMSSELWLKWTVSVCLSGCSVNKMISYILFSFCIIAALSDNKSVGKTNIKVKCQNLQASYIHFLNSNSTNCKIAPLRRLDPNSISARGEDAMNTLPKQQRLPYPHILAPAARTSAHVTFKLCFLALWSLPPWARARFLKSSSKAQRTNVYLCGSK